MIYYFCTQQKKVLSKQKVLIEAKRREMFKS